MSCLVPNLGSNLNLSELDAWSGPRFGQDSELNLSGGLGFRLVVNRHVSGTTGLGHRDCTITNSCSNTNLIALKYCLMQHQGRQCLVSNHWVIANDSEVFPEPHKFNPQRWIDDAGHMHGDLKSFTFGFGHRKQLNTYDSRKKIQAMLPSPVMDQENGEVQISQLDHGGSDTYFCTQQENDVEMDDSDEELGHISIKASKVPVST
ncbi:uncharacterized protein F5147DRAFT_785539 [Suillus discolor]|uniref:Uncharacterized protein n=1 Tax=Suillus discolor TaxID=1912936 RepID=A0A9P7FMV8_9AGAM|nr:uncharacterized protein F5147DRAFT_785539 [Suillus discolor]KAG2120628.1 hypothetical protein F5147DRAFT_785539 [Suillus discolor]